MLVLTRKTGEQIVVPQCQLTVTVLDISGNRVRLGVSAPREVAVLREEIQRRPLFESNPAAPEGQASLSSARILLADADQYLLNSYSTYLWQHEASPSVARSGLECLERLKESLPDVLVLAAELPWGGAEGVLALMAEQPSLRPSVVMLLSHKRNRSALYRLSSFKVDDYQLKPLTAAQLVVRIGALLVCRGAGPNSANRPSGETV